MKQIILIIFWLSIMLSFFSRSFASGWDSTDTVLQAIVLVSFEIDRRQTLRIKDYAWLHETNPILGRNPSDVGVNNYFITTALVHTAIAYLLPEDARTIFQMFTLGVEAGAIGNNYSLGLRVTL